MVTTSTKGFQIFGITTVRFFNKLLHWIRLTWIVEKQFNINILETIYILLPTQKQFIVLVVEVYM